MANILIVDDDPAVQATIRIVLERAGHHAVAAGDGERGLAIFEAGSFELLILDIFMPRMDGLETMRLIRRQRPKIPILVISGRPIPLDSEDAPDFLTVADHLGAVSCLQKPFKPDALLAAIAGCLEAAKQPSSSVQVGDIALG